MLEPLLKPVPTYSKAPCEMQREWTAHNSRVDSVRQGKLVVYKAPCDMTPMPKAGPKVASL